MRYTLISCISSLLLSSVVYAADCVKTFDQSCFSQSDKPQPADDGYEYRQQQMEEARKHINAVKEYEQAQARAQARAEAEWRAEMREEERLIIESERVKAMNRQADAIEGVSGELQDQKRAIKRLQSDIELRDLSR